MSKYKVDITGINTNDIKVLKQEEQLILFKKYKEGDLQAKEELVEGNLKLVLSILRKFNNQKYNMDDLFQIGCIGLIKAIDNFDLNYGVMFSTYAVPLILGEVKRYVRDNNALRVSRSIKDLAYKILNYKEEYLLKYGKEPSSKEIAKYFDINEYDIAISMDSLKDPMSIYEPIYNDGGETIYLFDQIENKTESSNNWNTKIILENALNKLKTKEQFILFQRYLIGKTQMEISDELGISQAQVSRIEKNALNNVKKLIK